MSEADRITCLTPDQVEREWPRLYELLLPSCTRSRGMLPIDYYSDLLAGTSHAWIVHDSGTIKAAGITRIEIRHDRKVCRVDQFSGSSARAWADLFQTIKEFAIHNGCKTIEFEGRDGWSRVIKDAEPVSKIYEVQLWAAAEAVTHQAQAAQQSLGIPRI